MKNYNLNYNYLKINTQLIRVFIYFGNTSCINLRYFTENSNMFILTLLK